MKLGITASTRLVVLAEPDDYAALLGALPAGMQRLGSITRTATLVHVFVKQREALAAHLKSLRSALNPEAAVWVSWPKKASKVPTTITDLISDEPKQAHLVSYRGMKMDSPPQEVSHEDEPSAIPARAFDGRVHGPLRQR
jgi:hypothetical protein